MHKYKAEIKNTEDIEMEMTISMSLKNWQFIVDQLDGCYESNKLATPVKDMIRQIQDKVYGTFEGE